MSCDVVGIVLCVSFETAHVCRVRCVRDVMCVREMKKERGKREKGEKKREDGGGGGERVSERGRERGKGGEEGKG